MHCEICESSVSERALFCEVCGTRVRRNGAFPITARRAPAVMTRPAPAPTIHREEMRAAVATREELGATLEPEVIDAFLARIETALLTRVDERVDARLRGQGVRFVHERRGNDVLPVAICSLIFGIPLTIAAGESAGLPGLVAAWLGMAGINFAVSLGRRSQ